MTCHGSSPFYTTAAGTSKSSIGQDECLLATMSGGWLTGLFLELRESFRASHPRL